MLILALMLLIGLFASIWGFLMCFFPAKWSRLTQAASFASRWTVATPKHLNPVVRLGNRVSGFAILAVGSWFAYVAVSKIYFVLSRGAEIHAAPPEGGRAPSPGTPVLTAFSIFMALVGAGMLILPANVSDAFAQVWPGGRSVRPEAAPRVRLILRVIGVLLFLLAIVSLMR